MKRQTNPREAIILAGGLGTRLRGVSGDALPKPMMPVCGRPFLEHLLEALLAGGIRHTVLAVGHRHDVIRAHFGPSFAAMRLSYAVEESPRGTGGAVAGALELTSDDDVLVLNGDSYIAVDIIEMFHYHVRAHGDITIALTYRPDSSRYGAVEVSDRRIIAFREKGPAGAGYINGGVYVVNRRMAAEMPSGRAWSFETDLLARRVSDRLILPYLTDGYFIDIGTPDDYRRAQQEFSVMRGGDR